MKQTLLCDLLGIEYPIIQGGMLWLADADLAAAVSESGALGVISPMAGMELQGHAPINLQRQIRRAKDLTPKPFAVNIPLDLQEAGLLIDVVLKEGVGIVITAAAAPGDYTSLMKSAGIKVLHVVSSVKHGEAAEAAGVHAIIAQGIEAGGRNGRDELPLFSLLPQVVDSVSIPVVATGGIADARGMAAALALGAQGVQLGTRFIAVNECIAHPAYKQALLEADDAGTVITCRKFVPTRSLKTGFASKLLALEESGASAEQISNFLGWRGARSAQIDGDLDSGEAHCGASVGLIREIIPAGLVVQRLMQGYREVIERLQG